MRAFVPGPDTAPWWRRLREGELTVQTCRGCHAIQAYPRAACAACLAEDLELRPASGRAEVWSFTVVWRAPDASFAAEVPYVLALVTLEEGPRLLTRLCGLAPDEVRVGLPVRLVRCEPLSDGVAMPLFGRG